VKIAHSPHMTPAQAAAQAGLSRWSIMRAINSGKLKAIRDNRNCWQISEANLKAWLANAVRTVKDAHPEQSAALAEANARATAAERARDQAEADRDRWQRMAEQLAQRPRFTWPWRK
jgi:excisionase family DNA binding protein